MQEGVMRGVFQQQHHRI